MVTTNGIQVRMVMLVGIVPILLMDMQHTNNFGMGFTLECFKFKIGATSLVSNY